MILEWTGRAIKEVSAARDYLAATSPIDALTITTRILDRADEFPANPYTGPEVPEYGDPNVREIFVDPYRVVYELVGDVVRILALIHSSRAMPRMPPV
jgi:toxin ParE1/3/4